MNNETGEEEIKKEKKSLPYMEFLYSIDLDYKNTRRVNTKCYDKNEP